MFERGGLLRKTDDAWAVQCMVCHGFAELWESEDFDPADLELHLPKTRPPLTARFLTLRVLGLTRTCWKCHEDTTCLVGLYPQQPARGFDSLHTGDEITLALMQKLLRRGGRVDLAETIKIRYSSIMGRYLSNGCIHCDALQGDFYLQEDVCDRLSAHGLAGLEALLTVDCPVLDWYPVVHQNGGGISVQA
ncbi:hypothetical protein [Kitasatospora sp. NPDC056531]|uniref:hypothetical protein n=1 Tax=Kitasatospora sp. NPDC056531 TaxID=3345856 RepID=UPI0036B6CA5F